MCNPFKGPLTQYISGGGGGVMNTRLREEGGRKGGREDVCNPLKTILFRTYAVAEGLERPPPATAHVFGQP
jgi:hypothetical protein